MTRWILLTLVCAALAATDSDHTPEGPGRMQGWVPEDVPVLRGMFLEDGSMTHDRWAEMLRVMGWGYLRAARNMYNGDHGALLNCTLNHLAARTGHPEIPILPICTLGYSRFSGIHMIVVKGRPGQLLSFASGFDPGLKDAETNRTPNIKVATDVEDLFSADRSRQATSLGPPWLRVDKGTRRCFVIQWRQIHTIADAIPFAMAYWDQVQRLRVPADWDPRSGKPAVLREIPETEGWLADTVPFWTPVEKPAPDDIGIAPYSEFPADRRDRAAWLPDRETAWLLRAITARFPWGRIESPCLPYAPTDGIHTAHHNALGLRVGTPVAISVRITVPDAAKVEAFVWSEAIGSTATITGGELGTTRNGTASFTWTPPASRIWPIMIRVTRADGKVGWLHPAVVPVHPARDPAL